jgi:hypothetical protein
VFDVDCDVVTVELAVLEAVVLSVDVAVDEIVVVGIVF